MDSRRCARHPPVIAEICRGVEAAGDGFHARRKPPLTEKGLDLFRSDEGTGH
jgi:hypothetical protein